MTEYISRELAKKFFTPPEGVTFMQLNVTVESLLETLDSIPAADVVERASGIIGVIPTADVRPVVLCRDCEYWNRERISCEGLARCNTGESGIRYRSHYDFCSRGAKREES